MLNQVLILQSENCGGVLGEILNLIESVSDSFPSYFCSSLYAIWEKSLHMK